MASSSWVLVGDGSLLAGCGDLLLGLGHRIAAVLTREPTIEQWAAEKGIPVAPSDAAMAARLRTLDFDHLATIAHLSIVPADALREVRGIAVNFHDGPLPHLAGLNVTSWALLRQEPRHGVTWHVLTERADAGSILEQRLFDVASDETAFLLNAKCYAAGLESFAAVARRVAAGDSDGREQDLTARRYFGRFARPPAAAVIDWRSSAEEISALVRALDFGVRANPLVLPKLLLGDDLVAVSRCVVQRPTAATPGTLVAIHQDSLQVATSCGDAVLSGFTELDGAPLSLADLVRRYGLTRGSALPLLRPEVAERLTDVQAKAARAEAVWLSDLHTLGFPDLDLPVSAGRERPAFSAREIDIGPLGALPTTERVDTLIAAIAVLAARRSGTSTFDVAYADNHLAHQVHGTFGAFSSALPLRLDVQRAESFGTTVATVAAARQALGQKGPLAGDLWGREPLLRAAAKRGGLREATVSVGVGVEPPRGRLRFAMSADGSRCTLLASDELLPLAAQLEVVLASVVAQPERPIGQVDLMAAAEMTAALQAWNNTD